MYNIITLEVIESHKETFKVKMFGHWHMFSIERNKGETFTIKHTIDKKTQKLIEEGKLKVVKELATQ